MKGITDRQKLSRPQRALEEAGVKAAGFDFAWIPRIIVLLVLLLLAFILLRLKILTWTLLVLLNIAFLAYWIHVMRRAGDGDDNDNSKYQSPEDAATIATTRTVSSKRIFT